MTTQSFWLASHDSPRPEFPKARSGGQYDVVVIGGGITGVTAAYLLKQSGKRVCLVEKHTIGSGETGHTSAHLAYVTDARFHVLVNKFGNDVTELVWKGGLAAIAMIEKLVNDLNIDCGFKRVPGYLVGDFRKNTKDEFFIERDYVNARELGFEASFIPNVPGFGIPGARFADQARFHPIKYIRHLVSQIPGDGSDVFEHSEVSEIIQDSNTDAPPVVRIHGMSIPTQKVVIATHIPLEGSAGFIPINLFRSKLYAYMTYVVSAEINKGLLPEALFWDTRDPYSYLRVDAGKEKDRVYLGGGDHKTGQQTDTEHLFRVMEDLLDELIAHDPVDYRWSGEVVESNDRLPFIGEFAKNQFIATGFAGNGLTFGTLAAMMAVDYVFERPNPWADLFLVHRKKFWGGTWEYLTENMDYPFYFIRDLLMPPKGGAISSIPNGSGKVLKIEGQSVACARDNNGELHMCSAACTHMGCLVRWNNAEQTWDCPCHGSRFSMTGEVISGPAEVALSDVHKMKEPQ